jgi:hypothetical protein
MRRRPKGRRLRAAFVLAVASLGAQPRTDNAGLTGRWTAADASGRPATLTFLAGGLFEIEFRGDDGLEVTGTYRIENNRLIFTDEGGIASCLAPEYSPGTYLFTIRNGELTLDAIGDRCDGRALVLQRTASPRRAWVKQRTAK